MSESIEERLNRIETYLNKRYVHLKEKPRTSNVLRRNGIIEGVRLRRTAEKRRR
jgi:hypothetical protein